MGDKVWILHTLPCGFLNQSRFDFSPGESTVMSGYISLCACVRACVCVCVLLSHSPDGKISVLKVLWHWQDPTRRDSVIQWWCQNNSICLEDTCTIQEPWSLDRLQPWILPWIPDTQQDNVFISRKLGFIHSNMDTHSINGSFRQERVQGVPM